jgi:hypothetical protein
MRSHSRCRSVEVSGDEGCDPRLGALAMSIAATLFTYLWHYLVARLLYDDLIRPLTAGRMAALVPPAAIVISALLVTRALRRARSRRRR